MLHRYEARHSLTERPFHGTLHPPAPPPRGHGGEAYAVLGVLVLVAMLLIATGTVPVYEWHVHTEHP